VSDASLSCSWSAAVPDVHPQRRPDFANDHLEREDTTTLEYQKSVRRANPAREPAISLQREIPHDRLFDSDEQETKLLDAANPHLRAIIIAIALLDTAYRPGEILSLQWKNVNLERKEITIQAEKRPGRRGWCQSQCRSSPP